MSNIIIRPTQVAVPLSKKQRPVSRYDGELLNTFIYMYENNDTPPPTSLITVSAWTIPAQPLSKNESAIYGELYDHKVNGEWNLNLIFPTSVPAYVSGTASNQASFRKRLGKYEMRLYYSIKYMLDADVQPRS